MLTGDEIEAVPTRLEKLMNDLQLNIMTDLTERLRANGSEITAASDWQLNRLYELGMSKKDVQKFVKQTLGKSDDEINRIFEDVIQSGYAHNAQLYTQTGRNVISYEENKELQQLVKAVKAQTKAECKNITGSMGFAVKQANGTIKFTKLADYYQNTLDSGLMQIASGAFDYNTVLCRVVKEMTNSGLRTVTYASGHSDRVTVAARRALITGFNQVVAQVNEDNARQLGTDYFEVSYHSGARPTHQIWQGRVYSKAQLESVCGLGTVTGLCGANCYHSYSPFVPGVDIRTYTDEQLDKMNAEENTPVEYGGKQYTKYEATQRQRALERAMRANRQEIALLEAGGADEESITAANARYRKNQDEYVKFSKAMNLPQQWDRVTAGGARDLKITKAKTNMRAVDLGTKTVAKSGESGIIEVNRSVGNSSRYAVSQEHIDRVIQDDMSNIKFTSKPMYNPRIHSDGKTTIREYRDRTVDKIEKIEIGKQSKSSMEFLEDTILHEELEARIAIRSKYSERYKKLYNAGDVERHKYINRVIKRYFKMRGWNYDLV